MIEGISTRRILYWLAAVVALLAGGTIIGLIWADTSNVAGAFAGVTNVVSVVGIVLLLITLAVKRWRRPRYAPTLLPQEVGPASPESDGMKARR